MLRPLKVPHTKFGKDWTVLEEVIGNLARALPNRHTLIHTYIHTHILTREVVFLAESCKFHLVQKYARNDLFSGLIPVFFIDSAERTLNYTVD